MVLFAPTHHQISSRLPAQNRNESEKALYGNNLYGTASNTASTRAGHSKKLLSIIIEWKSDKGRENKWGTEEMRRPENNTILCQVFKIHIISFLRVDLQWRGVHRASDVALSLGSRRHSIVSSAIHLMESYSCLKLTNNNFKPPWPKPNSRWAFSPYSCMQECGERTNGIGALHFYSGWI